MKATLVAVDALEQLQELFCSAKVVPGCFCCLTACWQGPPFWGLLMVVLLNTDGMRRGLAGPWGWDVGDPHGAAGHPTAPVRSRAGRGAMRTAPWGWGQAKAKLRHQPMGRPNSAGPVARQGCGEKKPSPAEVLLGQGLMSPQVLGHGQGGGDPGRVSGTVGAGRTLRAPPAVAHVGCRHPDEHTCLLHAGPIPSRELP